MKKFVLDRNRIISDINRFPMGKVLVVGDLMLDEFIWGQVERISPEAPVPVVWVKRETKMPGGAANVARNISSLGGKAIIAGIVGNDEFGKFLVKQLESCGIDTSSVIVDESRPTTVKTRVVAHNQQVVRIDREIIDPVNSEYEKLLWEKVKMKVEEVDAVIIEDYGKGVITKSLLSKLVPYCHRRNKIVTVDPKKDHFSYYYKADIITPNRKELSEAVGNPLGNMEDVDKAARRLMRELELKGILVTLSEEGMKLYLPNRCYHIPTSAQEVYDVSGAGDTVIATFTLARAIGEDAFYSAVISNFAAGLVVGKVGVATATAEELVDYIDRIMQWKSS